MAPIAGVGQVYVLIAVISTISVVAVVITITIVVKLTMEGCSQPQNRPRILEETQTPIPLQSGNYVPAERNDDVALNPRVNTTVVDAAEGPNIAETSTSPLLENAVDPNLSQAQLPRPGIQEQPRPILPSESMDPLNGPNSSTPRPGLSFNESVTFSPIKG